MYFSKCISQNVNCISQNVGQGHSVTRPPPHLASTSLKLSVNFLSSVKLYKLLFFCQKTSAWFEPLSLYFPDFLPSVEPTCQPHIQLVSQETFLFSRLFFLEVRFSFSHLFWGRWGRCSWGRAWRSGWSWSCSPRPPSSAADAFALAPSPDTSLRIATCKYVCQS